MPYCNPEILNGAFVFFALMQIVLIIVLFSFADKLRIMHKNFMSLSEHLDREFDEVHIHMDEIHQK